MKLHHRRPGRRGGFTLIELMVVITIIAILVSLLSSAVIMALNKMDEVKTRNEISGLSNSISQFEKDNNIAVPPPSRIWLDGSGPTAYTSPPAGYTMAQVQQLGIDSQAYLHKVWPRINIAGGIAWNSGNNSRPNNVVLEGEECLVFFLGGAQDPNTGAFLGFSSDASNPMSQKPGIPRKGPYFVFATNRIGKGPNGYPTYYDPYTQGSAPGSNDQAYAYFSSGKTANGYNAYINTLGYDCQALVTPQPNSKPIQPYYQQAGANQPIQYYNPDTFQIISAGKNQRWGPGGLWASSNGSSMLGGRDGIDDMSNFYNAKLGTLP